jgi:D-sedoheptulose 7-phosphate isomerase
MSASFAAEARAHVATASSAIARLLDDVARLERWGERLAAVLTRGGRLLAAGNGGSAAQAQHLTSELVGRYRDERAPLSALALHAESSSTTAIANDYGAEEMFARQVRAHGRPGDVFLALSTSGQSRNLLVAARDARALHLDVWAITGHAPNPLASSADDALVVDERDTAIVQEVHQVAIHLICEALEDSLARPRSVRDSWVTRV